MAETSIRSSERARQVALIQTFREAEDQIFRRKFGLSARNTHFVLRIPGVSSEDLARWEGALNRAFQECGCLFGARCGVLALLLAVVWGCFHLSTPGFTKSLFIREIIFGVVAGGIAGKVLGMGLARIRIYRIAREMRMQEGRFSDEGRVSELA